LTQKTNSVIKLGTRENRSQMIKRRILYKGLVLYIISVLAIFKAKEYMALQRVNFLPGCQVIDKKLHYLQVLGIK